MERRTFLRWLAGSSALPLLQSACGDNDETVRSFPQGVASGDPTPDGVRIWTRIEPVNVREHVMYELAADPDFRRSEGPGEVVGCCETDYTVRVELTGRAPATMY